jgi:hypothetical protein
LTAYGSISSTRQAFRDYAVDDFIDKLDFDDRVFLEAARVAIRNARLRRANIRSSARYRLTMSFSDERLVGSELVGPNRRSLYIAERPVYIEIDDLARRTDNLNLAILHGGADVWRKEASSIGRDVYRLLSEDRRILTDLSGARALAPHFSDLWIQFSGPAGGLGMPFELLRDEEEYLGLSYILTRRLVQAGPAFSLKPEAFHVFVEQLIRNREPLRALVVGSNSDGAIPAAEEEARAVAGAIDADLAGLGIAHEVVSLIGAEASYTKVSNALREGHYHLLHYAGHGRYADRLPEVSGLVLRDERDNLSTLTAADLNLLIRGTKLRMIYLSCCLSARTAANVGRGDFYGVLEALARADVPTVLGYRWTVADGPARELALNFYQALWHSFSPGQALLEARRAGVLGSRGRDDETWMSLLLLMQNM